MSTANVETADCMPISRFLLPRDVYLSFLDHGAVFLDLRRDKYIGLDADQLPRLKAILTGHSRAEPGATDLARELVTEGLLTLNVAQGRAPLPAAVERAHALLLNDSIEDDAPELRFHHVVNFAIAYVAATISLRLGVDRAVHRVRRRRQRNPLRRFDFARAQTLVRIFRQLRPLVLVAEDRCLFHSMMLIEFLARYRISSTWVFGVKLNPFMAHCWVQQENFVLNGRPEFVGSFTPIMVV
jgi:hypothetical protein